MKNLEYMKLKTWQEFEKCIASILEDYKTEFRKVFNAGGRKHEIDVVVYLNNEILCIDCKKYGKHRSRVWQLKKEAKKHVERTKLFARKIKKKCFPVIVTEIEDELKIYDGCFIVSLPRLNDFILNFYSYKELL